MNHRFLIAILSLFGLIAAGQLTGAELAKGNACPDLGGVPACYLVFGAYGLIFVSALMTGWLRHVLFLASWLPVFALALIASGLDLAAGPVCPRAFAVVPQCFLSLALAVAIVWVWILGLRSWQRARPLRS
tara:strand:- start:159 stop:551 length:393 start_codon:yes stop_codon:yes gene_type:complete